MKLIKTAEGKTKLKISREEWEKIGREAKWKGDVEIEQTGEWAGKSVSELKKRRSALQKKQDSYKKEHGKANKEYTEKLREINFAIRSKGGWKKGKGAAD